MHDILKDKALAQMIYDKIQALTGKKINHGVVAGGSVAGWLIEHARGIKVELHDIDHFVTIESNAERANDSQPQRTGEVGIGMAGSMRDIPRLITCVNTFYTITSTKREGNLNTINIAYSTKADEESHATALLQGFDLNCCQAGMIMSTGKLIATEEFLRFLTDYQLMVTSPVTPHHTVMRLPKKATELGCYVNYDIEYSLLASVPHALHAGTDSNEMYMRCFSRLHLPEYMAYKEKIDPYFRLRTYTRHGKRYEERETLAPHLAVAGLYEFIPKFRVDVPMEVSQADMTAAALRRYYDEVCRPKSKGKASKNMAIAQRSKLLPYLLANTGYSNCDVHEKHMDRLDKFISNHPHIAIMLADIKVNMAQQLQVIRAIEHSAKKKGRAIYGLAETADNVEIRELASAIAASQPSEAGAVTERWLERLHAMYAKGSAEPLTEPLPIQNLQLPEGAEIRELICQADLDREGDQMRHCVSGYARLIKRGASAIISIRHGQERSTLEIGKPGSHGYADKYIIVQHKGHCNKTPDKANSAIAKAILEHLNHKKNDNRMQTREETVQLCA